MSLQPAARYKQVNSLKHKTGDSGKLQYIFYLIPTVIRISVLESKILSYDGY